MDIFNDVTAVTGVRTPLISTVSGNLLIQTYSTTGINLLQFGGTTNAYPALKRSGTTLAVRLSDDSGYGDLQVGNLVITGSTTGLMGLPSQTSQDGKYLTTNGTSASWATVSSGSQWTTSGSYIYYSTSNGNVGIGTNAPDAKLHVVGDNSMIPGILLTSDTGEGSYPIRIEDTGHTIITTIDSSGNFLTTGDIGTGGSQYIYLSDHNHSMSLGPNGLQLTGWAGVFFNAASIPVMVGSIDQTGLHVYGAYDDQDDYAGIKIDAGQEGEGVVTFSLEGIGSYSGMFTNYQFINGDVAVVGQNIIVDGQAGERCYFSQKNNGEFVWGLNVNSLNGDAIDDPDNSAMKFGMMTSINGGYNGLHYQTVSPNDEGWGASQTVWSVDYLGNMDATSLYLPIQNGAEDAGQPYISSDNFSDEYFTGVALWCTANYELLWKNGELFLLSPDGNIHVGSANDTIISRANVGALGITQSILSLASAYSVFGYSNNSSNGVYGGYDGEVITGAYFQSFGTTNSGGSPGPGGAEIIIDAANGACSFNVGVYDGSSYTIPMTVLSNGYVGIGTASPVATVSVDGNQTWGTGNSFLLLPNWGGYGELNAGTLMGSNGSGSGSFSFYPSIAAGDTGATVAMGYASDGGVDVYSAVEVSNVDSGYGNLLLMKSGGNVGIGVTDPQYLLDLGNASIALNGQGNFASLNVNSSNFTVNSNGTVIGPSFYSDASPLFCIPSNARFGFTALTGNPNAQPDATLIRTGTGIIALGDGDASGTLQLTNLALQPVAQPGSPVAGQIYFDTNSLHFYGYNGTAWVQLDN